MLVKFRQDKVRETPPGLDQQYYVEFRTMNRPERDRAVMLMVAGDAVAAVEHLLECGISDFCLPSDEGDVRFGNREENRRVYAHLDAELANWMVQNVLELNGLTPEAMQRKEMVLGNSGSPSAD